MRYIIPDYYKEFQCTADRCEDTCCAGWQIAIDQKSIREYGKVTGDFRRRMFQSVDWIKGIFRQDKEKRCAFLNEKNLCDLYANLGKESLCRTCRMYPRHIEEFENVREMTLSLSCPEVARILMEKKEPTRFLKYEKAGKEKYKDFDQNLYRILTDTREKMLQIMQNRDIAVEVRIGMILGMAHDMQVRVNHSAVSACMKVAERYQTEKVRRFVEMKCRDFTAEENRFKQYNLAHRVFRKLYELELQREEWDMVLMETEEILYAEGAERYREISAQFTKWEKETMPEMEIQIEQLIVYFLSVYYCGAVYDKKIYAKVRMAVESVFMLWELWKARWGRNGGMLDM
ncbi:MAG: flagellin lysine-N-methylase, partial [Bariatricus sp.]